VRNIRFFEFCEQSKFTNKAHFDPFNPISSIFAEAQYVTTRGTGDVAPDLF
jgi:hypothetical protein